MNDLRLKVKVGSFHKHTLKLSFNGTCIIVSSWGTSFLLSHSHGRMVTRRRVRWYRRESLPTLLALTGLPFIWEPPLSHRQQTLIGIIPKNQRWKRQDTQLLLKSTLYGSELKKRRKKTSVKTQIMPSLRRTKESREPPSARPNFIPIKCFRTTSQLLSRRFVLRERVFGRGVGKSRSSIKRLLFTV